MASIGHLAVGVLVARAPGAGARATTTRAVIFFAGLAVLPDVDIVPLALGWPDGGPLGHRGLTHSVLFAVVVAAAAVLAARRLGLRRRTTFALALLALGSHGLLDAMNFDGGGVPLLWPLTAERYILPWAPLRALPKGAEMLTVYGLTVLSVELLCFLPLLIVTQWPRGGRRWWPAGAALIAALGAGAALSSWVPQVPLVASLLERPQPRLLASSPPAT